MTNEPLTNLDHALLGLLGFAPMSGYDVQRVFASTPMAHFSSSPGAIYPALKRLERRGMVSAELDRTREARPRRVYSLTDEGTAELARWVREPVTREQLLQAEGEPILRFAFMEDRLSREEVIAYLEGYRSAVEAYVEELRRHRQTAAAGSRHAALALEHGIAGYESQMAWADRAIEDTGRA